MSKNSSLKGFVDRIERLNMERDAIGESINEVYNEAQAAGFDKKIVKLTVKVRKDKEQFRDDLMTLDVYMIGLGDQLNLFSPAVGKAHDSKAA